ncbi:MAG: hypothetical protein IPK83_10720 [Planctomycetes bacterium]|nr:hypothetical protein [Planctomycetota bacterium]
MTRTTIQKFSLALATTAGLLFSSAASAQTGNTAPPQRTQIVRGWINEFYNTFPQYVAARTHAQALADQIAAMENVELVLVTEADVAETELPETVVNQLHVTLEDLRRAYATAVWQCDRLERVLNGLFVAIHDWRVSTNDSLRSLFDQRVALMDAYDAQKRIVISMLNTLESNRGDVDMNELRIAQANLDAISQELSNVIEQINSILYMTDAADFVVNQWRADAANRG